jgi:formyltetrahydrofolate synthetase
MTTPNRFAVKSVARCSFISLTDGKVLTYLDTLKSSGVSTKSTTVYARGGEGNAKLMNLVV